ncbi:hypothetical protein COY05_03975 [Candidatus Peregrinibacteria bacterium CG_4_10_14_0_2_um_filter_38_24]|nr:MAG: hypothetical protein COY05_03975 [Candidatus Peregrinibacteria bacterium CG_4_10_14_0_2_um_filter_38_24]PJC38709.1 MAG: hypothetical protein CO044_03540 [Candidatus Peregrinibacteria bacterium CG_4_9_14_0_2_um_filter_38_9]
MENCKQCGGKFEITSEDLTHLSQLSPVFDGKKFSIPSPKKCPSCRQQNRLAFRNERTLYTRKCDLSGKQILSIYSPERKEIVYCEECYLKDLY